MEKKEPDVILHSTKKILEAIKEAHKHPIPVPGGEGRVFGRYLDESLPHTPQEIHEQFAKIEKDKRQYIERQVKLKRDVGIELSPHVDANDVAEVAIDLYEKQIPRERGGKGGSQETRLKGIVAAVKKYKTEPVDPSFGKFWLFISHSKYSKNTPYKIDGYSLYVEGDNLYHRDETKKNKRGKIKSKWKSRPKRTIERYFYEYSNEITPQ